MRGGERPCTEEEQDSTGACQRRKCMAVWVSGILYLCKVLVMVMMGFLKYRFSENFYLISFICFNGLSLFF